MKILTCLFLLLAPCCIAQTFTFNQGGPASSAYYEEIPYENINGKLFVEGEIAGKKHRFLFDTGAPVAISKELAAELNARVLKKILMADAFSHTDSTTIVEINDLKLGNLLFNHIPATTKWPDFFKCYNIDGVIGSNLLRNSIISIVPSKRLIIITDQKDRLSLKSKNSAPLISNIGTLSLPFISVVLKGKRNVTISIEFDTGDETFLRGEDRLMGMIKPYAVFDTLAKGYGADRIGEAGLQDAADKYLFKIAPIFIGNGSFINLVTESNKNAQPAIGSRLLDYGIVTLDFIHGKFYFDADLPVNDLAEKQWPFRPAIVGNKLIVGVIFQKAPDALKQGDQIIAIDNIDYSQPTFCDLINSKKVVKAKETIVLTTRDTQGNIKKMTVKKE